ncbi:MAG: hypothetical protein J6Y28_06125 [Acholeplasmatales bacterium]|nr:hypothetical protein [Acholeplasmatales bacterium]
MDELKIVKAMQEDLDSVCKVINDIVLELFPHYFGLGERISIHQTEERLKEEIKDGYIYKVIVNDTDELIGVVTIINGELENMYLFPFYQKRGYGRKVLSIIETDNLYA